MHADRHPPLLPLLPLLALLSGCATIGAPEVLYIARHGQTEYNRVGRFQGDPDLDPVGYVNRVSLWHLLRDQPIAAVYTSERQRTQRTAELVARQHQLPLQPRAALNEIQSGVFEGICYIYATPGEAHRGDHACAVRSRGARIEATLQTMQPIYAAAARDKIRGRFPLGESTADVARRTATFVAELERGMAERQVLVVGHGVVNRTLLHHLLRWPLEAVGSLRQENDQVYRVATSGSGQRRLALYTPGVGWRDCRAAPRAGDKRLDCSPAPTALEAPPPPAASRPGAPGEPAPAR